MTKTKQMKLVLLYAINELGGTATKDEVLNYINNKGYWQKNDDNDINQNGRNELKWRNEFAFERSHLVKEDCIDNLGRDEWKITPKGEDLIGELVQEVIMEPDDSIWHCTNNFLDEIRLSEMLADEMEEFILIEQMNKIDALDDDTEVVLTEGPLEKEEAIRRSKGRKEYPRDPKVAHNAFKRAEYKCEISGEHHSFIRRTTKKPYFEPHHIIPLAYTEVFNVNLDREQNVVALCSECHNKMHYGTYEDIKEVLEMLYAKRHMELASILGREISFEELCYLYGVR